MLSFRTRGNFVDFVHTDNTSLEVESVIMSLHNTSKAVDWSLPEDTTRISFTIDDISYDNILITDIDFDGVTMTAQADFKTNIETIFPGLAGGGGSGVVETIVAGSGIAVDATDPANPEVSATGGGGILSATVTLTNAQILALPSTPIQVVPAPGANKIAFPIHASYVLNNTTPYVVDQSCSLQLIWDSQFFISSPVVSNSLMENTGLGYGIFPMPLMITATGGFGNIVAGEVAGFADSGAVNKPIQIADQFNEVANYTGGNAANTLKVTVYYVVVDL